MTNYEKIELVVDQTRDFNIDPSTVNSGLPMFPTPHYKYNFIHRTPLPLVDKGLRNTIPERILREDYYWTLIKIVPEYYDADVSTTDIWIKREWWVDYMTTQCMVLNDASNAILTGTQWCPVYNIVLDDVRPTIFGNTPFPRTLIHVHIDPLLAPTANLLKYEAFPYFMDRCNLLVRVYTDHLPQNVAALDIIAHPLDVEAPYYLAEPVILLATYENGKYTLDVSASTLDIQSAYTNTVFAVKDIGLNNFTDYTREITDTGKGQLLRFVSKPRTVGQIISTNSSYPHTPLGLKGVVSVAYESMLDDNENGSDLEIMTEYYIIVATYDTNNNVYAKVYPRFEY